MSQTQSLMSAQVKTIKVAVTSTSSAPLDLPGNGNTIRVYNGGATGGSPKDAFYCISAAGTAATVPTGTPAATCTPIGAGIDATFSIPDTRNTSMTAPGGAVVGDTFPAATPLKITAICDGSDSTTLWVSVGEGM